METALKQRLLGAAVLVALAVTFLPMLVTDPAPESGASSVPLEVPRAPKGGETTIELPLAPDAPSGQPVLAVPTPPVDVPAPAANSTPATAAGAYAVTFGSYATAADAERVVGSLKASQLPGFQEPANVGQRTVYRVRIGPYASEVDAEAARLRAAHVRDDVNARVIVLDAPGAAPAVPAAPTREVATAPRPPTAATAPEAPPAPPAPAAPPTPVTSTPAAAGVGFAIQLGAFANGEEANRLRDRARAAGFSSFVEQVRTENGVLNRVRIGPVTDRAAADALRAQVSSRLGVSGLVRPHP